MAEIKEKQELKGNISTSGEVFASMIAQKGARGEIGPQGPSGPEGPQGPQGVRGKTGIVSQADEPTDEDVYVWVDTDDDDGGELDLLAYENKIETVSVNGAMVEIEDKNVNLTIPTKISELEDDIPIPETLYALGADYAEYFEWEDGNPNNEDRTCLFVSIVHGTRKIKKAMTDEDILGIVSLDASIIGNARFKDNVKYSAIGMTGVMKVRDNGLCEIGDYIIPGDNGLAIPSKNTAGYKVTARYNSEIIEVLLAHDAEMISRIKTDIEVINESETIFKNKVAELETESEVLNNKVTELETENEILINQIPTGVAEGESITLNDSTDMEFKEFVVGGNSIQDGEPTPETPVQIQNVNGSANIIIDNGLKNTDENYQSQHITFSLAEGQKLYKGSYCADDGIHHKREQKIIDGTVGNYNSNDNWYYVSNSNFMNLADFNNSLSNFFTYKPIKYLRDNPSIGGVFSNTGSHFVFRIEEFTSSSGYKNFFAQNPFIVEFDVSEEIIEPYTEEQQKVYNEIKKAHSYKNVTHIFSPDEIKPINKVTYRKDLETMFNNINTAIVSLGGV